MKEGRQLALIKEKKTTTLQTKAGKDMEVVQVVYDRLDVSPAKETTKNLPLFKLKENEELTNQLQTLEVGSKVCLVVDNDKWGEVLAVEDVSKAPEEGSKSARGAGGSKWNNSNNEERQNSIIFQNSLSHATALVLHNSTGNVTANDILTEAYKFYDISRNPEQGRKVVEAAAETVPTQTKASLEEVVQKSATKTFDF
jgi:hypothetical protein